MPFQPPVHFSSSNFTPKRKGYNNSAGEAVEGEGGDEKRGQHQQRRDRMSPFEPSPAFHSTDMNQQQQQQQQQQHEMDRFARQLRFGVPSNDTYNSQSQQQQEQPTTSDSASMVSSSSSTRSRYRQDYSRSQHTTTASSTTTIGTSTTSNGSAPSSSYQSSGCSEMSPEKQRFEAYINRFAQHDPRASPIRYRRKRPPYTQAPPIKPQLQQHLQQQQQQQPRMTSHRQGSPSSSILDKYRSQLVLSISTSSTQSFPDPELKSMDSLTENNQPNRPTKQQQQHNASYHPLPASLVEGTSVAEVRSKFEGGRSVASSPSQLGGSNHGSGRVPLHQAYRPLAESEPLRVQQAPTTTRRPTPTPNNSFILQEEEEGTVSRGGGGTAAAAIETPSPARVTDLKRQLWDHDETLQVTVQPSVQYSTVSRRYYYQNIEKPEMAGREGQRVTRSLSPERPQYRKFNSRFYEAAIASRRMTKYANVRDVVKVDEYPDREERPMAASPTNDSTGARASPIHTRGGESKVVIKALETPVTPLNSATFKSRFLQAAYRSSSVGRQRFSSPTRESVWRRAPVPQTNATTAIASPATEPEADTDASVAKLVARLNAVNRENPAEALAKIDSILKAESKSSSEPSKDSKEIQQPKSHGITTRELMDLQRRQEFEDEEDSDSDDETSVSSITNPTYQSTRAASVEFQPASQRARKPNALEHYVKPQSPGEVEKSLGRIKSKARPPPPTSIEVGSLKESQNREAAVQEDIASSRAFASDGPSAAEIARKIRIWDQLTSTGNNPSAAKTLIQTTEEDTTTAHTSELGSLMTPADATAGGKPTAPKPLNNVELLVKQARTEPMVYQEVTTFPEESHNSTTPKRIHPWDQHHPKNRSPTPKILDTSMEGGVGLEITARERQSVDVLRLRREAVKLQSDVAAGTPRKSGFTGDSFDVDPKLLIGDDEFTCPPKPATKSEPQAQAEMSHDFDSAWVALPPSAFFGEATATATTKPGRSPNQEPTTPSRAAAAAARAAKQILRQTQSAGNPMPPSATKALRPSPSLPAISMPPIPNDFPSPQPFPVDTSKSPAGKRKFNFLKRRGKSDIAPLSEEKPSDAYSMESLKTARSKSHSPGRRMFAPGSDINGAPRNTNLAKKFSRLMRVYDNE